MPTFHWFTGLEMSALDWATQLERLNPVMDRVSFLHGREGDCSMRITLHGDAESPHLPPFRDLWFRSFMRLCEQGKEEVWLVPELLGTAYEYARLFEGKKEGEGRQDAMLLRDVAMASFHAATNRRCRQGHLAP